MNPHREILTQTEEEEELSDERILANIERRMRAPKLPPGFDARALAVRAAEQYWADRAEGIIDREGRPIDDIILANRVALRRLRDDEDGSQAMNLLAFALPLTAAIVVLLRYPSFLNGPLFQQSNLIVTFIVVLLAAIVLVVIAEPKLKQKWLEAGKSSRPQWLWLLTGGLLALTMTLGMGFQNGKVQRLAAKDRADRQRAEERLKSLTEEVSNQGILQFSHKKMWEIEKTGGIKETPDLVETIPVGSKKINFIRKKDANSHANAVVWRAEGEPLPEPLELSLNKESGRIKIEGSSEETLRFYAAVVKEALNDKLTLIVKDENGHDKELPWNTKGLPFQPVVGQRLFVVVDPKTNMPTEVTQFKPDVKKDETPVKKDDIPSPK